ncbi:MAG: NUDIX hydrolase [Candidatus Micrarchaeia archaeon]
MQKYIYKNRIFGLQELTAKVGGKKIDFAKIIEDDAIVVVPVINGRIILEKQYRPVIGKYIYELPAGHIRKGEKPINAVIREMKEETGYTPKKVKFMFKSFPAPGLTTSMHYFFVATDMRIDKQKLDPDEIIDVVLVDSKEAFNMLRKNKIKDSKTIAALLYYFAMQKD